MKMYTPLFMAISSLLFSCGPQRLDVCDCLDIEAALTDSLLLSKKELKAKSEGCAWVTEELSPAEQSVKLIECYSKNAPATSIEDEEIEGKRETEDTEYNEDQTIPKPRP